MLGVGRHGPGATGSKLRVGRRANWSNARATLAQSSSERTLTTEDYRNDSIGFAGLFRDVRSLAARPRGPGLSFSADHLTATGERRPSQPCLRVYCDSHA